MVKRWNEKKFTDIHNVSSVSGCVIVISTAMLVWCIQCKQHVFSLSNNRKHPAGLIRAAILLFIILPIHSFASKLYVNDNSTIGDVYTTATGNNSNTGTSASPFLTMNFALSVANAGDTIYVDAGTYGEAVNVNKAVTILGANAAVSPNTGTRTAESILNNTTGSSVNISTVNRVVIKGFKVITSASASLSVISNTSNTKVTMEKNLFDGSRGLSFISHDSLLIVDNRFTNIVGNSDRTIFIQGNYNGTSGSYMEVYNNTWINSGCGGMNISSSKADIYNNIFSNIPYEGVLVANYSSQNITRNVFTNIYNPDLSVNTWGAGVRFYTPSAGMVTNVTNNYFTNDYVGIAVRPTDDVTGRNISIYDNSFSGNTFANINHTGAGLLMATCNWFGNAGFCIVSPGIKGKVRYIRYRISGIDADAATMGFQPDPSSCLGPDTDGDGIPDDTDIDDDNDGNPDYVEVCGADAASFSCTTNGSDPWGDDDNDGTVNWKDADWGTLNAVGCVASLDSDGDGIPDFLDLDSDNDGIPDVIEAGGVDANGDGIIDNFCDTDGDGLSQNADANSTGAAGSGQGLGAPDFDNDGVANTKDLDSDNDGIPDIVESFGTDANNDGMADSFADNDWDGWSNQYDGDADGDGVVENVAGVLILTSTDNYGGNCSLPLNGKATCYTMRANSDNSGLPNFLDLDSDGDGITDATESGITATTYFRGMVTGCTLVKGWCTAVSSLASLNLTNTDNNGRPDVYDTDSDNDGISDNVEAQATASFITATDMDTDGDGIADVYDIYNGIGGNGLTPYDHDADGLPDYTDTDTDNDGAPDRNEGDKRYATLSQATINASGDTDGDGMMDYFDTYNLSAQPCGTSYMNVSMSNMGAGGNFNGPAPGASSVQLTQSLAGASNRDWRSTTVLPLQIISFTGSMQSKAAMLRWKAVNQQQVEKYFIERSQDGISFASAGFLNATGISEATYSYSDALTSYSGNKVYYRLRQANKNASTFYSGIISFNLLNQQATVTVVPNPVSQYANVTLQCDVSTTVSIDITDISGRILLTQTQTLPQGNHVIALKNIEQLAAGVYILRMKTDDRCTVTKFIKQ